MPTMSEAKFETLCTLYRAADFGQGHAASLIISNEEIHKALETCLSDVSEYAVGLDADEVKFPIGSTVQLQFGAPRSGLGTLADNLAQLLGSTRARLQEPKDYFLIDGKFAKNDAKIPDDVEKYRLVLRLIEEFQKAAAFLDKEKGMLVFVHGGKFELPINYEVVDLLKVDNAAAAKLLSFVGDDTHKEKKLGILEGAMRTVLESWPKERRLAHLLSALPQLAEKARDGYQLFIADFSYDKVRDATEAAKVEYAAKIHKAFSDIQTQILGIPVATIVVATQMKDAKDWGYEFWVNTAVLAGCWVFAILVGFVLWNQTQTLAVLNDEITRQQNQIQRKYKDIADQFAETFMFLHRRLCLQRWALGAVGVVLVVGLALAHLVYFKVTAPAQSWFPGKTQTALTASDAGVASPNKLASSVPATAPSTPSAQTHAYSTTALGQDTHAVLGASGAKP
jgi:hypothetical protein